MAQLWRGVMSSINNKTTKKEKIFNGPSAFDREIPNGKTRSPSSERVNVAKRGRKKISKMVRRLQMRLKQNSTDRANNCKHSEENECLKMPSGATDQSNDLCDGPGAPSKANNEDSDDDELNQGSEKSVSLLPEEDCDIPTFLGTENCDASLIAETRRLLIERYNQTPDSFYEHDYRRMLNDDWTVSRFLLRRRLDPRRTVKLMEECGLFRCHYKMSEVQLWEFPVEFHQAGALFMYAPDRVGNVTVYMRVKMYRRVPEISDVFKAFILCVLEAADTSNNGRGLAVIFDLSSCGLKNVDLSFLSWLLSSFRNYCPKGVSYIMVYNLPWILNATAKLAMTWMSNSNRRALRFVHGREIENFIAPENLPDYVGGTCKINYRAVPKGSRPAIEVCDRLDMTPGQALKIRELFAEYLPPCRNGSALDGEEDDDDQFEDCCQVLGEHPSQSPNGLESNPSVC